MGPQSDLDNKELTGMIAGWLKDHPLPPASVYRLQFHRQFNFNQATKILDYLHDLGIQAIYASPYYQAKPESRHGYDVTDANAINPEIGSVRDFEAFCRKVESLGMTQIMDVVANHMGIGEGQNQLWQDVLENGPSSVYARFFDIDWEPEKPELKNKVLLPILGDHYGTVLENQEIRIVYGRGEFKIQYWQHELPVAPKTYPSILEFGIEEFKSNHPPDDKEILEYLSIITAFTNLPSRLETDPDRVYQRNREKEIAKERLESVMQSSARVRDFVRSRIDLFNGQKGDPQSFDLLDTLLNEQAYRVASWRVASDEINYRRFFDINDLAAIRTEDDEVFRFYHQLIFRLILENKVRGLRIDHPDGLYDPPAYFRKLQKQYMVQGLMKKLTDEKRMDPKEEEKWRREIDRVLERKAFSGAAPLFIVVEKILDRKEQLPEDWAVQGTVGYDFLNVLNGLFVERSAEKQFDEMYHDFIGKKIDFGQMTYEKKKFFALVHMSSEINHLAHRLDRISERNRSYRDFTLNSIAVAIREVIACFPVYRTYVSPQATEISERDERYIRIAIEKAKRRTPALPRGLYDFLYDILSLKLSPHVRFEEERGYRDFILRFQQLTGPVMAKGLEDTAFYLYNRLISLNEVGGDPTHFGFSPGDFHRHNSDRLKRWPASFLSTSTHDTKRSEDVRMRINAISEFPEEWKASLVKWSTVNEKHKTKIGDELEPDRNTEYFIYQTLIGIWPNESLDDDAHRHFVDRVWTCLHKSIREAKEKTNWVSPDEEYEEAVRKFLVETLTRRDDNYFFDLFVPFQKKIAECGFYNSLSSVVLKAVSPGVVDTYQGNELWDYSLVDPDNRRDVDYDLRRKQLNDIQARFQKEKDRVPLIREWRLNRMSGNIKLALLWRVLQFRNRFSELFFRGDYTPLQIEGEQKNHVIAFARKKDDHWVLAVCGRYFGSLLDEKEHVRFDPSFWKDTSVLISKDIQDPSFKDLFTGQTVPVQDGGEGKAVWVKDILNELGAAVLTNES